MTKKLSLFLISTLSLIYFSNIILASDNPEEFFFVTADSTKAAKINVYVHAREGGEPREKPVLLVHGFNSKGDAWRDSKVNYVENLTKNGYDVIVVDMRGNPVDTDGDHKLDSPVVGNSWGYGVRDLGDDVATALVHGLDYLNKSLPNRNYKKVDVITHSTGALAVTSYSRGLGLIPYRNNIDTLIELAPPNNGSTNRVANIKNIGHIAPSVGIQAITTYEYALGVSGNRVWIPGGRMESENLRKELLPESFFLKGIEGLGPDPRINTFVGIGDDEDWVVGNWSPVIEGRDDIGYEYFADMDHFTFTNSELVITAILDKLEKGEESSFFNRYKPYKNKNMIAFASGPGIDHPDDTFDVVTFAKDIDISPRGLFDLYLRIAGRKDKKHLLRYWEALLLFEKAQQDMDKGTREEDVIDKWNDLLSEQNEILHDNYISASEEYLECPDIAILSNGFYNELAKLIIEKLGEPVRIIDHTFNPSILNEQKLLIIPSGGLSGLSHSSIFRRKLSEFVKNGGTIICFSQANGYDFNALPGSLLNGYGWQEDASCHSKAAYIENFHQILSSQTELYPDIKLDGYFTNYPDNVKVLLRRTKNLMPAMLMYDFGKGIVIAASLYSDWGYSNGQASLSELNLIRDLIRWSKNSKVLPEYNIGKDFRKSIEPSEGFNKIEFLLKSPDGNILERRTSDEPIYELGTALNSPGIYCVDYILYDSLSRIIQPQTEGFYFCFSQPPEGSIENPDFTFNITTPSENYASNSEVVFTFHIKNNTDKDELIKSKATLTHNEIKFTKSINVPANTLTSFDNTITARKTDLLRADFYSSANDFLGRAERGINVFEPDVEIDIATDRQEYIPGQRVLIQSRISNNSKVDLGILLVLDVVDAKNSQILYRTKSIILNEGEIEAWNQELQIPNDAGAGIFKIKLNAFSNDKLVGSSSVNIDIPGPLLEMRPSLPDGFFTLLTIALEKSAYRKGESIPAEIRINNKGDKIDSAVLDIRVLGDPEKGYLFGVITDKTDTPIKGAKVKDVYTDDAGRYRLDELEKARISLDISIAGYDRVYRVMEILPGANKLDVSLSPTKHGNISGSLKDHIGSNLVLELVEAAGSDASNREASVSTDNKFEFKHVPVGAYRLKIQPEDVSREIQVNEGDTVLDKLEQYLSTDVLKKAIESEPNDDFDTAETAGIREEIMCKMHVNGDQDYFVFDIKENGIIYIKMKHVPAGLRPSLKIYNASYNIISQKAGFSGERIELEAELGTPGKYYLMVKDWYSSFFSQEGYAFETHFVKTIDEYEPNNAKEDAVLLDFGKDYFATIATKEDTDFYKLSVPDAGKIILHVMDVPPNIRPYMKIYRSSRDPWIYSTAGFGGEDLIMEFEADEPSNWFIQIQDRYNSESSHLRYRLLALYIPDSGYSEQGPVYFHKEVDITNVVHTKKIAIDIPGMEKNGRYYLQAALKSLVPEKNAQALERFYITEFGKVPTEQKPSPDISLSYLGGKETSINAGEKAEFRFKARNQGEASGRCNVDFKFMDLFNQGLSEVLEPDTEKELVFAFFIPQDMEEAVYQAEYIFEGEKAYIDFKILGIRLEVKTTYEDGIFKIKLKNQGSLAEIGLFAEARYGSFEERKDFTLGKDKELNFNIPDINEQDKIYYGVYFSSGKAIYLNSFSIKREKEAHFIKPIEAGCDKGTYAKGDSIFLKWKVDSEGEASVGLTVDLISPDSTTSRIIDENIGLYNGINVLEKKVEPEFTGAGLYRILYQFSVEGAVAAQGGIFFDVGDEVKIDVRLDKKEYVEGDIIKLTAACFSSIPLQGDLKIFLDGEVVREEIIDIDGYSEYYFSVDENKIGQHRVHAGLSYDGTRSESERQGFKIVPKPKPNHSPILFTIGEKRIAAGKTLEFSIEAKDIDGDELFYNLDGLPAGAYFNSESRIFSWRPDSSQAGEYFVTFTVSDGKDSASERVNIIVSGAATAPPKVMPLAEPLIGTAPLEVYFSADSVGANGEIVKYEWDFDGKGVYDFSSLEAEDVIFIYTGNGDFPASLRLTDSEGNTSLHTVNINVKKNPNAPEVFVDAMPLKGTAPCKVYFKGSAFSSSDINKYEWDFDGDGVYDAYSLESGEVAKTYGVPGTYLAAFKATDTEGLSGSQSVLIEISDPLTLDAELIISDDEGTVPIDVNFDAFIKTMNEVQKYQWDFEGDRVFDYTSVESPAVRHTYHMPGLYTPTLRISDVNNICKELKKSIRLGKSIASTSNNAKKVARHRKGEAPFSVKFSFDVDLGVEDINYFWDFDDDGVCDLVTDLPKAEFIYYEAGVYVVEVKIKKEDETVGSYREIVYVNKGKRQDIKSEGLSSLGLNGRKNISKYKIDKVELSDKTSLILPAGVLDSDDLVDIKKLQEDEVLKHIGTERKADLISAGEYREYKFLNHDNKFYNEITLKIPYPDEDDDGVVDYKNIDELTLNVYWLDEMDEEWKLIPDTLVFPQENIVTVKTSHFSIFGLAGSEVNTDMISPSGVNTDCFIATAVFGTPMSEEVGVLREFRDRYLLRDNIGKRLVDLYYAFSPSIAGFIKDRPVLKAILRLCLKFLVYIMRPVL